MHTYHLSNKLGVPLNKTERYDGVNGEFAIHLQWVRRAVFRSVNEAPAV